MSKYRIISTQKQTASVINLNNSEKLICFLSKKHKPICGDHVDIQENKNELVISRVHPRKNQFSRANHKGIKQAIAANIDQQIIVAAPKPEPTRDLINRYLVGAHNCKIKPLIVFNKTDIDNHFFDSQRKLYSDLGYTVVNSTTKTDNGIDELKKELTGKTSIFVGMSGVGKSSLSEILLNLSIKTGDISKKTGKGSHVTSVTQLYSIPETQGYLIDSPGVWEYGLWRMQEDEIAHGFIEFDQYISVCKFSNCTHVHEPKCGVKTALENQNISQKRYQSYLRIIDSMKYWE